MININSDLIHGYVLWIYRLNFEFGCGPMIFDRVMPLELRNNGKFFRSLSQQPLHMYTHLRFDIWICHRNIQVEFEFGFGWWFLTEMKNSQFPLSNFWRDAYIHKTDISYTCKKIQIMFEFSFGLIFWQSYTSWTKEMMGNS